MTCERCISREPAAAPRSGRSRRGRRAAAPRRTRAAVRPPRPRRRAAARGPWRGMRATMPVSTSPVPAVASDGSPSDDDDHAPAGLGDERVGAFQQDDAAEALRRLANRREPVRRDLGRLAPEEPRELALVRRQHARPGPLRQARARRARRHRRRPAARPPRERGGRAPSARRRARAPGRSRATTPCAQARARCRRRGGDDAVVLRERALHGLEQALLEHGQRRGRRGDGDVAGVGAHRGERGERRRAGEPARAADDEHVARPCTCCRPRVAAAPSAEAPASRDAVPCPRARARCRRRAPCPA